MKMVLRRPATLLTCLAGIALVGCKSVEAKLPGVWTTDTKLSSLGDLKGDPDKFPSIIFDEGGTCHLMAVECTWKLEGDSLYVGIEKGENLLDSIGAEKGRSAAETKLTVKDGGEKLEWKLSREKGDPLLIVLKRTGEAHKH